MNQLNRATSPYLQQHAQNPVHWFAWGPEPFRLAAEQQKPVLVSIGYSTCHWCHVMAHESFEDEETAALMNALFINIKVDREELPDIDHMYMDAVQAMTGSGGWPLNVFVTPDKRPFYGGTYYPPVRAYGRASWKEVLVQVSQFYQQNQDQVLEQAKRLMDHLLSQADSLKPVNTEEQIHSVDQHVCEKWCKTLLENADQEFGGFGTAPKFPSTFSLRFMLEHGQIFKSEQALQQVYLSLDRMALGGMYDHLGGGFARYSTDREWRVPHFEKMLYDNALLISLYAQAYSLTEKELYRQVVEESIEWLQQEMTDVSGGFYTARDADTEGVEGKFYTWTYEELEHVLGDEMPWIADFFHIQPEGNWEYTNIFYADRSYHTEWTNERVRQWQEIRARLYRLRSSREQPLTDTKILLGWNALMAKALIQASLWMNRLEWQELGLRNIEFLLQSFRDPHYLYNHQWKEGAYRRAAYADDLVFLADALYWAGLVTGESRYYEHAMEILQFLEQNFKEPGQFLLQYTHKDYTELQLNRKDIYDGALPSVNAVYYDCLGWAQQLSGDRHWTACEEALSRLLIPYLNRFPASFAHWATLFQHKYNGKQQLQIVGSDARQAVRDWYVHKGSPAVNLLAMKNSELWAGLPPAGSDGETCFYVCRDFVCLPPFRDINRVFIEF